MFKLKNLFLVLIFFGSFCQGYSQEFFKQFKDSTDGALDLSYFLKDLNGVLPIVAPITEPAVGLGVAVAAAYFIPKKNINEKGYQQPDIAGIAGGYTQNGTWFVGGGYMGFWKKDRIRYRGVLGYGDVNLEYYRSESSPLEKKTEEFNINSFMFLQQVVFRMGKTDFFLGGKYQLAKTNVEFIKDAELPDIDPRDFELWNSGLSIITEYENLNNIFSPTKGMRIHLSYDQNLEWLGSDKNWGRLNFFSHLYYPVNQIWVPALRLESQLATGEIPFYAKPFVQLRGVPALRYQGDLTMTAETEHLFNLNSRWSLVGFTGIGTAFSTNDNFKSEELVWNAGGGFRYLIARIFGLKMGLDIARGPEDWAVYVVFGSSWMK